jgi:DNA adenine methylase
MLAGLAGFAMLGALGRITHELDLPPLIKWPGGRSKHAIKIANSFPKHDTYIEPFAGGASVFFRIKPVETMVLGDVDDFNIKFFNDVRKGKLRKCKDGVMHTRANFAKVKGKKDACSKFTATSISYQGNRTTFGQKKLIGKRIGAQKLKRLPEYETKLRRAHLRIGSFEKTMKMFDSPTAVHFLDPPWATESGYEELWYAKGTKHGRKVKAGDRRGFDPRYVLQQASKMKGYVYIVYGDHPKVRAAFAEARKCGWKTKVEKLFISSGPGQGTKERNVLVAIKKPGPVACKPLANAGRRKKAA